MATSKLLDGEGVGIVSITAITNKVADLVLVLCTMDLFDRSGQGIVIRQVNCRYITALYFCVLWMLET